MSEPTIRFDDGAGYERMMGTWSRLVGERFLDWLAPSLGWRWIDVGCGNGAFTELLVERCAPAEVQGIDPSEGQLAFARTRPAARVAQFQQGDALALPFPAGRFDAAVMALVIFFVPNPEKGIAEMVRVVRPTGLVASYAWDMTGGGFPQQPIIDEMRAMGLSPPRPPQIDASRSQALAELWRNAGLEAVELREITVHRRFADFDDFWETNLKGSSVRAMIASMSPRDVENLKTRVRNRLSAKAGLPMTCGARANAIRGRLPG